MVKKAAAFVLFLGISFSLSVAASNSLVKFKGAIGVDPVSNATGTANADGTFPNVTRNVVRGVNPPTQLWRIEDLKAEVKVNGSIKVKGEGLLLAGGNGIGTNANNLAVLATLICEPIAPFTLRNTNATGVPLEPNGDFRIDDVLTPAPVGCASPLLLIRTTGGSWLAAGILKQEDDDKDDDDDD